ncbi:MAG TPA: hypothetical protein PLU30_01350 [Verrucomicrobiae bacterium]|nr:hypothetical protein [Verrucomicrobiae bacterium]
MVGAARAVSLGAGRVSGLPCAAVAACGDEGFHVVDLSDPGDPRTLGSCGALGWAGDVVVVAGLAYVAEGDGGHIFVDPPRTFPADKWEDKGSYVDVKQAGYISTR